MFSMSAGELIVVLAIVLVIFGAGRIEGVGKSLGEAIREFKKSLKGDHT